MTGMKFYAQPAGLVLQTVNDIIELQKCTVTYADSPNGKICFRASMYGFKWDFCFFVTDIGHGRSCVRIEIDGEKKGKENLIRREFALLDSMLCVGAEIEFAEGGQSL
jgi:hypothetical protein